MDIHLPELDQRLQARYRRLVQEHTGHAHPVASGPRHLPDEHTNQAAAQAAWRFYRNRRTTLPRLAQPLLQAARQAAQGACATYALVPLDWSHLDLRRHTNKHDTIQIGQQEEIGYELFSALLLSDRDGLPLAPLALRLQAAAGVYASWLEEPQPPQSQLDDLAPVLEYVQGLPLARRPVFLLDAEADSVYHFRWWQRQDALYLVRCDGQRRVRWEGQEWALPALHTALGQRRAFRRERQVDYRGQRVGQYVAEVGVVLDRPARLGREVEGRRKQIKVAGEALPLRLVVSELRAGDGTVLERWYLLSNVPAAVTAATLALWYYWRWKIETYWKLLKGAGQQVEHWQQTNGLAVLKRLLVASMACVLVWRLARSVAPQAPETRALLVRLSGRQMAWSKEFTQEALLAGLWVLLAMREVLKQTSPRRLHELADFILTGAADSDTG
jgi:hypothetical protein